MTTRVSDTVAMAALFQGIVAKLARLRERNLGFRRYPRALIMENRWRALRYGVDGKLIDLGKSTEVSMRDLAGELLDFLEEVVDDLGSRAALQTVRDIAEHGSGADRQLEVYHRTGDLKSVVDFLVEETMAEVKAPVASA